MVMQKAKALASGPFADAGIGAMTAQRATAGDNPR